MEIVKVDPKEFGLDQGKATELIGNLPQIKSERSELEKQYDQVIKLDVEDSDTWTRARELRLMIQRNRTKGIMVWHKTAKDFFLKGGQFVDAIKRQEVAVNERMEEALGEIEKYEEIQKQKTLAALQSDRAEKLSKYVEDAHERNLSAMEDDVWIAYYNTKKKEHEDLIAAEKKAEQDRIAKEKAEAEERERIRKENEQLKKEAEERERKEKAEAEKRAKEEKARIAREEAERKAREEKEKKEREAYEAKLKAEREAREKIEREERAKREKLEAEIKTREEAERKAKEQEDARVQSELNKKDADKVVDLINDLKNLQTKYTFKSEKNRKKYADVSTLINRIIEHIKK